VVEVAGKERLDTQVAAEEMQGHRMGLVVEHRDLLVYHRGFVMAGHIHNWWEVLVAVVLDHYRVMKRRWHHRAMLPVAGALGCHRVMPRLWVGTVMIHRHCRV